MIRKWSSTWFFFVVVLLISSEKRFWNAVKFIGMFKHPLPKLQQNMKKYFPEGKATKRFRNPTITIPQDETFKLPRRNFQHPSLWARWASPWITKSSHQQSGKKKVSPWFWSPQSIWIFRTICQFPELAAVSDTLKLRVRIF